MTHFLHFNGAQYRFIAILLLVVFGISTATAIESDDINTAILVEGSLPPTWANDAAHPWYIVEDKDGSFYIQQKTADTSGALFTATLSFSYKSSYPTEITFEAQKRGSGGNDEKLTVKIDGVIKIKSKTLVGKSISL